MSKKEKRDRNIAVAREVCMALARGIPYKEFLRQVGKGGSLGAALDGVLGTVQGAQAYRAGEIDEVTFAKHVANETSCGFVTASASSAGTLAVWMLTGTMGPAALAAGMGASIFVRHIYRSQSPNMLDDGEDDFPE